MGERVKRESAPAVDGVPPAQDLMKGLADGNERVYRQRR